MTVVPPQANKCRTAVARHASYHDVGDGYDLLEHTPAHGRLQNLHSPLLRYPWDLPAAGWAALDRHAGQQSGPPCST